MCFDVSGAEMLDVFCDHLFLSIISCIFQGLFHVCIALCNVWTKLTIDNIEGATSEFNASLRCTGIYTSYCDCKFAIFFPCTGVQNAKFLINQKLFDEVEIIFGNISTKVTCNTTVFWEVEDAVRSLNIEDFSFDLWPKLINYSLVKGVAILI